MPKFNGLVLTGYGLDLMRRAIKDGVPVPITRVAVGDGELPPGTPLYTVTEMAHEVQSITDMHKRVVESRVVQLDFSIRTTEIGAGFWFREIGVYATHPELGEILYAYENVGAMADYMPSLGGATIVNRVVRILVLVGNAEQVIINIAPMGRIIVYSETQTAQAGQTEFILNEIDPEAVISVIIDGAEYFDWTVEDGKIVLSSPLTGGQQVVFREMATSAGGSGGGVSVETDPTVPDWAKQPEKPRYIPAEVGAAPAADFTAHEGNGGIHVSPLDRARWNASAGVGDPLEGMPIQVYDTDENGIVDDAERLGGKLPDEYALQKDLRTHANDFGFHVSDQDRARWDSGAGGGIANLADMVTKAEFAAHTSDTVKHVSQADRDRWDNVFIDISNLLIDGGPFVETEEELLPRHNANKTAHPNMSVDGATMAIVDGAIQTIEEHNADPQAHPNMIIDGTIK